MARSPLAQQTAAPRRSADVLPVFGREPGGGAVEESLASSGGGLHPYDQNRAIMIGLSTALVAAIAVIVALMVNLSWHKDLVQSTQKDRNQLEGRWTAAQQDLKVAQALAAQRAREAQLAAGQAAENQRLAQSKDQAYLAAQDQLRRSQQVQQQTQEASQRRLYVTQIRLAKQAWDRGDTNEVLRLLEPYRSDPAQQKFCRFAWYYLWGPLTTPAAPHSAGTPTLSGRPWLRPMVPRSLVCRRRPVDRLGAAVGRKLATVALERNVPPRSAGLIVEDQLARRASGLVDRQRRRVGRRLRPEPVSSARTSASPTPCGRLPIINRRSSPWR